MRGLPWIALIAFAGGIGLLGYSVATGESQVHLVVIIPVVTGGGAVGLAGMALLFVAMVLWLLSFARMPLAASRTEEAGASGPPPTTVSPAQPRAASPKFGGVLFLGPLPIVFGSNVKVSKAMLVLAAVMSVVLLVFFLLVLARA